MKKKIKILLVRDDKLGDLVLTFPAIHMLKQIYAQNNIDLEIDMLLNSYTKDVTKVFGCITNTIIHNPKNYKDFWSVRKQIKEKKYDVALSFFITTKTALLLKTANIKQRFAPKSKPAQIFYNNRLLQKRSACLKAEYEYNIDLVKFLAQKFKLKLPTKETNYHLKKITPSEKEFGACDIDATNKIDFKKIVVIHCANGSSALNISLEDYGFIASTILSNFDVKILVIAGPGEENELSKIKNILKNQPQKILENIKYFQSNLPIDKFANNISNAELFIAASTGTLHLSALFNIATIGFFSHIKTASIFRWRPINSKEKQLNITTKTENRYLVFNRKKVADKIISHMKYLGFSKS